MATPIPAVAQQVSQVAQQQPAMRPDAAAKNGASKFDQMMVDKADASLANKQVSKVQANELLQALQKTNNTQTVQKTGKADDLKLSNATQKSNTPPVEGKAGASKTGEMLGQMLTQVESRNVQMTKFVNSAMNGKMKLNQQQLLGLQAKVAEYSLELDLTGKVVEKATTGLKDTLRTQV